MDKQEREWAQDITSLGVSLNTTVFWEAFNWFNTTQVVQILHRKQHSHNKIKKVKTRSCTQNTHRYNHPAVIYACILYITYSLAYCFLDDLSVAKTTYRKWKHQLFWKISDAHCDAHTVSMYRCIVLRGQIIYTPWNKGTVRLSLSLYLSWCSSSNLLLNKSFTKHLVKQGRLNDPSLAAPSLGCA